MPGPYTPYSRPSTTPGYVPYRRGTVTPATSDADEGPGLGTALAGGGALVAAALVTRNPKLAASGVGKVMKLLNAGRFTSMLSGWALPKSVLGNVGEVGTQSIERGSLKPLKEFFSPRTVQDFRQALTKGKTVGPIAGGGEETAAAEAAHRWNPFGRIMGAADVATRGALQRAGLDKLEAEAAVLQRPLEPRLAKALDNPLAKLMFPFRRTPMNQFLEGFGNIGKASEAVGKLTRLEALAPEEIRQLALTAGTSVAGTVHGAATSEDRFPVSTGLATALANRYGVPYAVGVMLGRHFSGGNDATSNAAASILPFSEYGVESTIFDPLGPFNPKNSAGYRVYQRLKGEN